MYVAKKIYTNSIGQYQNAHQLNIKIKTSGMGYSDF